MGEGDGVSAVQRARQDNRGGKLSAVATRGGHLAHLDAKHPDHVVAVGVEAEHNAHCRQRKYPCGAGRGGGPAHVHVLVAVPDGSIWSS